MCGPCPPVIETEPFPMQPEIDSNPFENIVQHQIES